LLLASRGLNPAQSEKFHSGNILVSSSWLSRQQPGHTPAKPGLGWTGE
jgi:hypothetical protein